eukprot:1571530-Rhodomonas_salina.1
MPQNGISPSTPKPPPVRLEEALVMRLPGSCGRPSHGDTGIVSSSPFPSMCNSPARGERCPGLTQSPGAPCECIDGIICTRRSSNCIIIGIIGISSSLTSSSACSCQAERRAGLEDEQAGRSREREVPSPFTLRACYAMFGTEVAYSHVVHSLFAVRYPALTSVLLLPGAAHELQEQTGKVRRKEGAGAA